MDNRRLIDHSLPAWRLVFSLAWPVLFQQGLTLCVSLSDRILAGWFLTIDPEGMVATQAAMTTASYIDWLISCYTTVVSVGSTALVARFVGGNDWRSANSVTNQSLVLALVAGTMGSLAALANLPFLIDGLGLRDRSADQAFVYLRPLIYALPARMIESAGIACLTGAGDTRAGLYVLGFVAIINLPLAWLFFYGFGIVPRWEFPGIAIGTAVSHFLGTLLVLFLLIRGRAGLQLNPGLILPRLFWMVRILRISLPAAADSISVAFGQLWFIRIVNSLGDAASGAHGIALFWEALGYLSGTAFGTAAMALVGQSLGAERPDLARRNGWTAFALGCCVMSFMGCLFFSLAPQMFALFCPNPGQAVVVAQGVPVLRLVAFAMPFLASCIVFSHALRGAGDTRVPVLFTWIGFFAVRIPLAYLLTSSLFPLGLMGAWIAMFADIFLRSLFFLQRFHGGRWQSTRV